MNTQDWNDLMQVLDMKEIQLRQYMEELRAKNIDPSEDMLKQYRKVCQLQVKVELYLREALPV